MSRLPIRNVALIGPPGAGKSTLLAALADLAAGSGPSAARLPVGPSKQLRLAVLNQGGVRFNLLDTPGYPDFVGEVRAALRGTDGALFVVSAVDGVDPVTQQLWDECAEAGLPRAVIVTKVDNPRADFEHVVAVLQRTFGAGVQALQVPLHAGDAEAPEGTVGLIDLLSLRLVDHSSGVRAERAADDEHLALISDARDALIEAVIAESEDETLLDRYLAGDELDLGSLVADLESAVARGSFHPVLACSSTTGLGVADVLQLLDQGFPSPDEHPLPVVTSPDGEPRDALACDPAGPLCAEVIQTASDAYVGRVSLVRVFSGTLRPDMVVHVSGHGWADRGHPDHDAVERTGPLADGPGRNAPTRTHCPAGDICFVSRLAHAETADTLSGHELPLLLEPWRMPEAVLPTALVARALHDEDKLAAALSRVGAEDPTARVERDPETGQLLVWTMGEEHLHHLLTQLTDRFGVAVDVVDLRVPLRETFAAPARGTGRHVKQSGGHGQFGVCEVEVEPLPSGSGVHFAERVVGGAIPSAFLPSVEKGVRAQLARGVRAGHPVTDVQVTVLDGRHHSVDSSDMAFQAAGAAAVRDAAAQGSVVMLEPVLDLVIEVPESFVGPVMSDLPGRRGRLLGSESGAAGWTTVHAELPEVEARRYALSLRALAHGTARLSRSRARYEPMPESVAKVVLGAPA